MRAAVAARLGYDPFFPWAHDTVFVEVVRGKGAFHTEIKLVDADNLQRGARDIDFHGADCSALVDAMALTISLTIDPTSLTGEAPKADAPAGATVPVGDPPSPPPTDSPPHDAAPAPPQASPEKPSVASSPAPTAVRAHVGLGMLGSLGAAPAATAGLTLFGGLEWRAFSLDLEGRADLPASAGTQLPGVSVRTWLLSAALVPCVHFGMLFGCGVVAGGELTATSNAPTQHTSGEAWVAAGIRAGIEAPIVRSLSIRGYIETLGTFTPATLTVDGASVSSLGTWSGDLGIAVAWRFP